MSRPHDRAFVNYMAAQKAVVRLIGPRRTGKTELVAFYTRSENCPIVSIAFKPLPPDLASPAALVAELLRREILSLTHTFPKLHAQYVTMLERETPSQRKASIGGELSASPKLSASFESSVGSAAPVSSDPDIEIASMLRRLELAAGKIGVRPVVFLDEVQELIVRTHDSGLATIWTIRNEVQHHTHCRYVFAGSNQRLFSKLQEGRRAPFLNFGASLEILPLRPDEIDAWAVPLFTKGKRHIKSLSAATTLLCGKIGEVVDVCAWLWAHTQPGEVIDETMQRRAVLGTAQGRLAEVAESKVSTLTPAQAAILRWVLEHPDQPPFGANGPRKDYNPSVIRDALEKLVEMELVESFTPSRYSCATPLRTFAALSPELWAEVAPLPQRSTAPHQRKG